MSFSIGDDFLLDGDLASGLYAGCANLPIIDYHSHLSPARLAENTPFRNLTDIWIRGDHYKWRAMRLNGVPERFCSGDASDKESFDAWADTLPLTLRNPLHHWSALELKMYFGITAELTPQTAKSIWDQANEQLATPALRPRALLERLGVKILCTTDDPADDLEHHRTLRSASDFGVRVFPTFRPDAALALNGAAGFRSWIERLAKCVNSDISSVDALLAALKQRHDTFHLAGCRISDHGLERCYDVPCGAADAERIFQSLRRGADVAVDRLEGWRALLMESFAAWDREKNWVMMLHLGALRNNNSALYGRVGLDTGCDSIGDFAQARHLNRFLDSLDSRNRLPRTILFNSNPRDNHTFATTAGNFFEDGVIGKVQFGPAWWFLDTADGMTAQFEALSQVGLAHRFVGMVTDSRSFMSFSRHDYFRRVVSNLVARDARAGRLPSDPDRLSAFMAAVSFENARAYFAWEAGAC